MARTVPAVMALAFGLLSGLACPAQAPLKPAARPDPASGLLEVAAGSGTPWRSGMRDAAGLNDYWKTAYGSACIVEYFSESGEARTAFTGQADCAKSFRKTPGGGTILFAFTNPDIAFTLVYETAGDGAVRVRIPFDAIRDPAERLLSIRALPYFGSLARGSAGYIVLPDGSGGIVGTARTEKAYEPRKVYGERFRWEVTDQGQRTVRLPDYSGSADAYMGFPVFGEVSGDQAFLAMLTGGQFNAEIGVEVTPINLRTSVSARFIYREVVFDIFGGRRISPLLDAGERAVEYRFLSGKDAGYVGLAKLYRLILKRSAGGRPPAAEQTRYRLRLLMGVLEDYQTVTRMTVLTTFARAEGILKDLSARGATELNVNLAGWASGGYLGRDPLRFPPDAAFGGIGGLRGLGETAARLGYPLGLQLDAAYSFPNGAAFDRGATVKDIQGIGVDVGSSRREYLLCPRFSWQRILKEDAPKAAAAGVSGDFLVSGVNDGLFECYEKTHLSSRADMASAARDALAGLSGSRSVAAVSLSDYLCGSVSAFWDAPASASSSCDSSIPFAAIVLHGWIPYSFTPLNLLRESRREILKTVEYGGVPNAYLAGSTVEDLIYARHNPLFSASYEDWREDLLEEYRAYQEGLRRLQALEIVDHQSLSADVRVTVYSDGTRTVVNYGQKPFTYGGASVGALEYAVLR